MKKIVSIISALALIAGMSGCDTVRQVAGAYNFVNCEYDYNSISNLAVSGISLTEGKIGAGQILQLTSLLTGNAASIPLSMTVNVDITNPNLTEAMMEGLQYILSVDGLEFTRGQLEKPLSIPAGGKDTLPVNISVDLKQLLTGDAANTTVNAIKNIAGIGDQASKVTVQLKPSFKFGSTPWTAPSYIPVSFNLGGK